MKLFSFPCKTPFPFTPFKIEEVYQYKISIKPVKQLFCFTELFFVKSNKTGQGIKTPTFDWQGV
jgi:hypothetical protein